MQSGCAVAIGHKCADAPSPINGFRHGFQFEPVDVDQFVRRHDFEFHQIEQIGATGDESGAAGGLPGCSPSSGAQA